MPSGDKKKRKKSSGKESELDSALDQVGDESAAAAINEFRDLLTQAKGDTTELVRQNARRKHACALRKLRETDETCVSGERASRFRAADRAAALRRDDCRVQSLSGYRSMH